jgi:transcriptional regulator with XRE-family HTH domain
VTRPKIETIPALLRVLRALHNWTQADLAEAAGLNASTIFRLESDPPERYEESVEAASRAAGILRSTLHGLLLPTVEVLLAEIANPLDPNGEEGEASPLTSALALEGLERERTLLVLAQIRAMRDSAAANAWYPLPEHRAAAPALWARLEKYGPEEQSFLIDEVKDFHCWALAEHLAHLSEAVEGDPARAIELAATAMHVASKTQGAEAWLARLRGYVRAFQALALRGEGREVGEALEAIRVARSLWDEGAAAPEILDQTRFIAVSCEMRLR